MFFLKSLLISFVGLIGIFILLGALDGRTAEERAQQSVCNVQRILISKEIMVARDRIRTRCNTQSVEIRHIGAKFIEQNYAFVRAAYELPTGRFPYTAIIGHNPRQDTMWFSCFKIDAEGEC